MKRSKRPMPIPQYEFGYAAESFRLIQDTAIDGERVARERTAAEEAKRLADAAQAPLFQPQAEHL
jgi:hypothetical protein